MNKIYCTVLLIFSIIGRGTCHPSSQFKKRVRRIIGGNIIPISDAPYFVSVKSKYEKNENEEATVYFCGGVLVSRQHVLTAAHCIEDNIESIEVTAGTNNFHDTCISKDAETWDRHCRYQIFYQQRVYTIHGFKDAKYYVANDIAVIKLKAPFPENSNISPVKISWDPVDYERKVTIVGFGQYSPNSDFSPILKAYTTQLLSYAECKNKVYCRIQQMCTPESVTGICQGDSGGPVVYANTNELVAIVSQGAHECGKPNRMILEGIRFHKAFIQKYVPELYYD